jgi:hypothetical protein
MMNEKVKQLLMEQIVKEFYPIICTWICQILF